MKGSFDQNGAGQLIRELSHTWSGCQAVRKQVEHVHRVYTPSLWHGCVKLCQICLLEKLLTVEVLSTNTLRSHCRIEEVIFIYCRRRRIIFYESIKLSTFVLKYQSSAPPKSRSLIREGSSLEFVFQLQCNINRHFLFNLILHVLI